MKKRDKVQKYDREADPWYEYDKKFIDCVNSILEVYGTKDKNGNWKKIKKNKCTKVVK